MRPGDLPRGCENYIRFRRYKLIIKGSGESRDFLTHASGTSIPEMRTMFPAKTVIKGEIFSLQYSIFVPGTLLLWLIQAGPVNTKYRGKEYVQVA